MNEMVDWLIGLEDGAAGAYIKAAALFADNPAFQVLLKDLSKDEKTHGAVLRKAKDYLESLGLQDVPAAVISIDEETKWDIEAPLIELRSRLDDGKMTEKEMLNFMLIIEYSELNDLFLSILGVVKECSRGEICLFSDINEHKGRIEAYLASHPGFESYLKRIKGLSVLPAERKLLIVDDMESNLSMLRAIFEGQFKVDTAHNGAEAFEKLSSGYYSAVISDVEMPVMDGVEFYMKARDIAPGISGRFIFYTASLDIERISFFNENRVKYFMKPASISKIRAAVMDIAS